MSEDIIIGDVRPRIQLVADGTLTEFIFPFAIFEESDLQVYLDDQLQTTGFTITGAGQSDGGSVFFDEAPANGIIVSLIRRLIIERISDFAEGGAFPARVINRELDEIVAVQQQLDEDFQRSLKLSPEDNNASLLLPKKTDRASKVLAFDAEGEPVVGPEYAEVSNAATYAQNAQASQSSAAASEANAALSESNAANSALVAQNAVENIPFDVERRTFTDNPLNITEGGKLWSIDTTLGDVSINLPSILIVGEPTNIIIRKSTGDANRVFIYGNGSDTINGSSSFVIDALSSYSFYADIDTTPDNWEALNMGGKLANPVVQIFKDGVDYTAGMDTQLTISGKADTENAMIISFDGLTQHHDTYSVSGQNVDFISPIPASVSDIEIHYLETVEIGAPADGTVSEAKLTTALKNKLGGASIGDFKMSLNPIPDDGWLLCDGSEISRTTYAELFVKIGAYVGAGDGASTFNLPDLRGKFMLGSDGATFNSGDMGGEESVTLTEAEMPSHTHTGSTSSGGTHSHSVLTYGGSTVGSPGIAGSGSQGGSSTGTSSAGSHAHSMNLDNTGGDQAHNNMPPYLTVNYFVKAL